MGHGPLDSPCLLHDGCTLSRQRPHLVASLAHGAIVGAQEVSSEHLLSELIRLQPV